MMQSHSFYLIYTLIVIFKRIIHQQQVNKYIILVFLKKSYIKH